MFTLRGAHLDLFILLSIFKRQRAVHNISWLGRFVQQLAETTTQMANVTQALPQGLSALVQWLI
jgi:hypothetical protein